MTKHEDGQLGAETGLHSHHPTNQVCVSLDKSFCEPRSPPLENALLGRLSLWSLSLGIPQAIVGPHGCCGRRNGEQHNRIIWPNYWT